MTGKLHKIRQSGNLRELLDIKTTEFNGVGIEIFANSVIVNGNPFTSEQIIQLAGILLFAGEMASDNINQEVMQ